MELFIVSSYQDRKIYRQSLYIRYINLKNLNYCYKSDLLLLLLTSKNFEQVMNIDNINERINYNIERDIRD